MSAPDILDIVNPMGKSNITSASDAQISHRQTWHPANRTYLSNFANVVHEQTCRRNY